MINKPLHFQDLIEISRQIQAGRISSEKVTSHLLERINTIDPKLHSFATLMAEESLAAARQADQEISDGKIRSPLHGVPIAVKDLLWTEGTATAHGMPLYKSFIPNQDATTVKRLRDAGAIILGKLQQTEGAFTNHHPKIKAPINPWDSELWSGVSSSGSGVATAAGLCFASLGTDTGGSIRFPSAANGITGIKPTWGRVSRYGSFELAASLDHIGPMARSTADAAALLGIIAGPDPLDPTAAQVAVPDYLTIMTNGVSGLRLGWDSNWAQQSLDSDTQRVLNDALKALSKLGVEVKEIEFPDSEQIGLDWAALCGVETAYAHRETYPKYAKEYGPDLAALIDLGLSQSVLDYQELVRRRADFTGRVNSVFGNVDLVLAPATTYAGVSSDDMSRLGQDPELLAGMLRYTSPIDVSGHPTITLPGGVTEKGAPTAFQLIAGHFREDLLVRAGWAYQSVTDWHNRHPSI